MYLDNAHVQKGHVFSTEIQELLENYLIIKPRDFWTARALIMPHYIPQNNQTERRVKGKEKHNLD